MAVANIPVHSAFEVITAQLGWLLYDSLWGILAQTGVVFVPIFVTIFELWMKNREEYGDKKSAPITLRQMENRMLTMVAVIFLAGTPALSISPTTVIMHKKVCASPAPKAAGTVEATPAPSVPMTYDAGSVLDGRTAEIPVWWYAALLLSGGINNVVTDALPCTADIRSMAYKLKLNGVANDSELTQETARFMAECYIRARQELAAKVRDGRVTLDEDDRLEIESFDSPLLRSDWYSKVWARAPVPPFPVTGNPLEEREEIAAGAPPAHGIPNCKTWWEGSGAVTGLRRKIVEQVNLEEPGLFVGIFNSLRDIAGLGPTDEELESQIIQSVLDRDMNVLAAQAAAASARYNADHDPVFSLLPTGSWHGVSGYNDPGALSTAANTQLAWLGNSWFGSGPSTGAGAYMIRESVLILHAIVLMVIYMALPFILVFSSYSWSVLFTTTFTLIAVRFWTVIWATIQWLDSKLLIALKGMGVYDSFFGGFDPRASVINLVVMACYVIIPGIWMGIVALGAKGISSMTNATSSGTQNANQTGQAGGSLATNIGKKIVLKGKK